MYIVMAMEATRFRPNLKEKWMKINITLQWHHLFSNLFHAHNNPPPWYNMIYHSTGMRSSSLPNQSDRCYTQPTCRPGPSLNIKTVFPMCMGVPMLKIRRSRDRLIFNMGIPIPGKYGLYIEMAPWCPLIRLLKLYALSLSGVPDYFYRNKISSGGDLSHYSSASLY